MNRLTVIINMHGICYYIYVHECVCVCIILLSTTSGLTPPFLSSSLFVLQVLLMVMEQPDGLPLHHICRLVGHAAWLRYITLKKKENGCMAKVSKV